MIEELAEEGHPGVERHGQAEIRLDVRDKINRRIIGGAEQTVKPGLITVPAPGLAAAAATAAGLFAV